MRLLVIIFLSCSLIFAQNSTAVPQSHTRSLSCYVADGTATLLKTSSITASIVLAYMQVLLPIIAEVVVAAIMKKLTTTQAPGTGDPGTVVPVNNNAGGGSNLGPVATIGPEWYDRIGLTLFAPYARTSQRAYAQTLGATTATDATGSNTPSISNILTIGGAVVAVIAGAAQPIFQAWCDYETQ